MANLQLPLNQDHEVLGSEYCSGYIDALGKWNNGFYCPASDESQDVFCCGNEFHKYCCTKKDQVIQSEVQDLTIFIGVIVGASSAILILTMVSCFCCSCCLLYKKRNPSLTSSMYRLHHNSSEHSGVTNMYSLSTAGGGSGGHSRSATPQHTHHQHRSKQQQQQQQQQQQHRHSLMMLGGGEMDRGVVRGGFGEGNGYSNGGVAHSHTLPHNLGGGGHHQHGKAGAAGGGVIQHYMTMNPHLSVYRSDNPDLIASTTASHHMVQQQRPYGTLGRIQGSAAAASGRVEQPPPYQDFQGSPYAVFVQQQQQMKQQQRNAESSNDCTALNSISRAVSNNGQGARMIFPHHQQLHQDQEVVDSTLFHSTKF